MKEITIPRRVRRNVPDSAQATAHRAALAEKARLDELARAAVALARSAAERARKVKPKPNVITVEEPWIIVKSDGITEPQCRYVSSGDADGWTGLSKLHWRDRAKVRKALSGKARR